MHRVIKLEVSANRKKILLINDLVPAVVLLFIGINSLRDSTGNYLTLINLLSGGLVVIFGLREWRSLKQHVRHKIRWYDLVSGIVLMLNAATMYKPWGGFQPAHLYFAVSVLIILKALSIIEPISLFRRLTISNVGFTLRTGPFLWFHFLWNEILALEIRDHVLNITTLKGQRQISLKSIADTEEMNSALTSSLQLIQSTTKKDSSTLPA
jgi:hypothetical protein